MKKEKEEKKGWYKNEKGEWCYEGECFTISASTEEGFKISLNKDCPSGIKEAAQKDTNMEFPWEWIKEMEGKEVKENGGEQGSKEENEQDNIRERKHMASG